MSSARFRWTCGYLNRTWFEVIDGAERYEARLRYRVCDYERENWNGTPDSFERDCTGEVGLLVRDTDSSRPIPQATIDAFNAWRLAEHRQLWHQLDSDPERYGTLPPDHPDRQPPMTAHAGRYEPGRGWRIIETASA